MGGRKYHPETSIGKRIARISIIKHGRQKAVLYLRLEHSDLGIQHACENRESAGKEFIGLQNLGITQPNQNK